MDIVVKGRHTEVTERFRQHVIDKLSKMGRLDPKVIRVDVELCREGNPRLSSVCERVELTCSSRGPVIRAEAAADDPYAALDLAFAKLENRLRRSADRRRVHHGARTPVSVAFATAAALSADAVNGYHDATATQGEGPVVAADGPFLVREKLHDAPPMTLDDALFEMELVGHDFFLFVDSSTDLPSVVYRRRGYDYGVIRLRSG